MNRIGVYSSRAAAYLGISRDMLGFYIREKGAPDASLRHGRKRLFTPEDLEALRLWLQNHRTGRQENPS